MTTETTEHPIIFNEWSINRILAGEKTQTRRIVKPQPPDQWQLNTYYGDCGPFHDGNRVTGWGFCDATGEEYKSPYGGPGDVLNPMLHLQGFDVEYAVDTSGNVWSRSTGAWKKMKTQGSDEYERLTLRKGGEDKNCMVHKLVCKSFYGAPPEGKQCVRHLDGDSLNNRVDNLDWGSYEENWADRKAHGNGIHQQHHNAKITMKDAEDMRASDMTVKELAQKYDLDRKTVRRILNEETWVSDYEQPAPNMPRELCRLRLRVEDVRVERVQEISQEDAIAEGIPGDYIYGEDDREFTDAPHVYGPKHGGSAITEFSRLWNDIHGEGAWERSDWVWVIEFSRIESK